MTSVVLDIDGVVCRMADAYDRWLQRRHGYLPPPQTSWHWYRDCPDGEQLWAEFNHPNVFLPEMDRAEVYPDAVDGVAALRDRYDLTFVTYRPEWSYDMTVGWLERHGMGGVPVVHAADKGTVVASLYVDDHPQTVAGLRSRFRNGVLMDRQWNQGWQLPRVFGWGDVLVEAARARATDGAVRLAG